MMDYFVLFIKYWINNYHYLLIKRPSTSTIQFLIKNLPQLPQPLMTTLSFERTKHPYVHCSVIYTRQDMEAAQISISR